jgi:hypothetical protein
MPPEVENQDPEALRQEREQKAREANTRRNAERLARFDEIADSAEQHDLEHKDLVEVTDEMLAENELTEAQVNARAIARAQSESPQDEDEEDDETPKNDQAEEARDEEARSAGADDVRIVDGEKQYRLVINGREVWKTLSDIRAAAQKVESADEYLQTAAETARRAAQSVPTAEEAQAADRKRQERLSHRKELLRRVAMGDEQAIEELAELDESAAPSVVTPDVLRALDERFDSRVTFREAVSWFEREYAEELKLKAMKSYAGELDAALAAREPKLPPLERLKRVGEQIRQELQETYGVVRGKAPGPSEKALRKAGAPRPPTPAGERQRAQATEEEAGDVASDIQKMAQARHQPRAVVHGPIRGR